MLVCTVMKDNSLLGIFSTKEAAVESLRISFSALNPKLTVMPTKVAVKYEKDGKPALEIFQIQWYAIKENPEYL